MIAPEALKHNAPALWLARMEQQRRVKWLPAVRPSLDSEDPRGGDW